MKNLERKNLIRAIASGLVVVVAIVFLCGFTSGGKMMYHLKNRGKLGPLTDSDVVYRNVEAPAATSADGTVSAADWAAVYPEIVATMGANRENSYVTDYLEQDPYLVNIYEGFGFAKEYGSARGHEYTLEDVAKTARPHPKANCLTCKTPNFAKLVNDEGVGVYSRPFDEVAAQMQENISCYTCHGNDAGNGGALVVTHSYVNEALGDNVSAIKPETLSCGQCHIEYYFTEADGETMMPYHDVAGMKPAAILEYYDSMPYKDGTGFYDWIQESTGTRMLKAQHPEMETFQQGVHASLLSCADCHMAVEMSDAGTVYHSHKLESPLESEALLQTCATCHGDTDMVSLVRGIQDRVTARETEVGNDLSALKDALAGHVAAGDLSEEALDAVRKLHREAQWFFDFCYVENSEGAHNSSLAMSCLDTADKKIGEAMVLLEHGGVVAPAAGSGLADGSYSVQKVTNFSTIDVEMTVEGGAVTGAKVSSEGANDLLTDENRSAWADQIVQKQAVDAVSGVTISSDAVQEAVDELMAQAAASAAPAGGLADGSYSVQKTTNFSTIDVEMTVEGGAVTGAKVSSEGANDLLTDENRSAWADQIVQKQAVDAVSGVTISSDAVQEAVDELMAQAAASAAPAADDGRVAELEAALAEAEAKAADAEARAADAEAKIAELQAEAKPAERGPLTDGGYVVEKETGFSRIWMFISVENGNVSSAQIASFGENDLLTDEQRDAWAAQIVENQTVDAVSGVTVSSDAVREGLAELLERAGGGAAQAEEEVEAPAERGPLTDGGYVVEKETGFSRIWMFISVENGNVSSAQIASFGDNDLLTDEQRDAWAAQIVKDQTVDAVSGVTVSSDAVREGLAELLERAGGGAAQAEPEAEAKPEPEAADAERISAILLRIVTTMGANRENSYVTDYLEQDPYLVNIYEGYGFAKDYGSARGHEYTLEDVAKTQRPHPKANCLTCKTPDLHKMIEQQGVSVYSMPFDEAMAQMKNNVSCYTCHGDDMGNGGALVVTHQYVNEALGENAAAINPATLSCGQCHIEYYFTPEDSEAMMPYHGVEEMTPEAILAYYDAMDFADWTQESTGTRMLKAQHPEMETVLQGVHAAFMSCADCHMPTETTADGVSYRSHTLVSPLENEALLQSCAKCHGDTDMAAYVRDIQARTTAREKEVGNRLSGFKDALAGAVSSGAWSEDDLNAARKLHREAQWFFDYCYVENAEGAHNTALATRCLDTAEAKIDEGLALLGLEVEPAEIEAEPEAAEAAKGEAKAAGGDAERLMRPRPAIAAEADEPAEAEAEAEPEAEEAVGGDAERLMRPRLAIAAEAEDEPAEAEAEAEPEAVEAAEVEAEAVSGDAERLMRPRPAL